ncbi:MAG: DHA2 family efflux MFS transporter permease subunit [Oryzomonas sp.]|uniref:DHA2 family efflux MFS transporter permease subunit n=1 Tax=Oryzomonas sp. TaxID=2855186 RepID=UPI00283F6221|nr:DHA2 family efflux MFS transporter permease subunit [Oryzomonas sp.]MDR3581135.1 DHA2 family efflux MFS transporter permease subunit [Oryzomonas sp.]
MTQVTAENLFVRYGAAYKWYVSVTVLVGLIAMVASATIVNVAMPDIMGEFGLGQDQAQWLSTAFLASMTAAMLIATWAVQSFGSRTAYISALVAFTVGSIIGAFSPNDTVLIVARIIQGAAAGVAQPLGMVAIFQVFPADRRGMAMGIYGMGVILAPALGPALGGMLVDNYSWRYVFFIGPPFCIVGILLATLFLPTISKEKRSPFDWIGFILLSSGIAAFLAGLSNGQRMGWDSVFVYSSFCLAAASLLGFLLQEQRTPTPILALDVYRNPRFVAASAVAFILGIGLYGSTYLVPLFVQTVQGYAPTESGLLLMPAGIVLGFVFPLAGRLSDRMHPHILILAGLAVFGLSNFLMSHADTSTEFWTFAGWVVIGRIGLGFILPSLNGGALRVLDHHLLSHGAGAINFIRQLGGAIGVDLLSVYLERKTTTYASELNAMQTGTHTAVSSLNLIATTLNRAGLSGHIRAGEAHRFLSRMIEAQASVMGFRESFLCVAVIFFAALLPAWYMQPKRRSDQERQEIR